MADILKVGDIVLYGDDLLTVATIHNNGDVILVNDDGDETLTSIDEVCAQNDFDPPEFTADEEPVHEDEDEDEPTTDEPVHEDKSTSTDSEMERRLLKLVRVVKKLSNRVESLEKRLIEHGCLPEPPKPKKGMKVKALFEGEWLDAVIVGKSRKTGLWVVEDEEGSWEVTEQEMQLLEPVKKTRRANGKKDDGDEMSPAQKRVARIEKLGLEEGDKIVVKDGKKRRRAVVDKIYLGNSKYKGYVRAIVNGEAVKIDPANIVKVL